MKDEIPIEVSLGLIDFLKRVCDKTAVLVAKHLDNEAARLHNNRLELEKDAKSGPVRAC